MAANVDVGILLLFFFRLRERYRQPQINGRTKLQKIIYIVSREHPFLNFHYIGYHYGPYSKELQHTLNTLSTFNLILENQEFVGPNIQYTYSLTEAGLNAARQIWSQLDERTQNVIDRAAYQGSQLNQHTLQEILPRAYAVAEHEGLL
jgi:uncharacterized protein YwgA